MTRWVALCAAAATVLALAGLSAGASQAAVRSLAQTPRTAGVVPVRSDSVSDRKQQLDQQIAELRDQLEGSNADFVAAAVALKTTQVQLANARIDLAAAQKALAAATAADQELTTQLSVATAEEAKAEKELGAQTKAEADTRRALGRIALSAYTSGGAAGSLELVLQSEDADALAARLAYAGAALRAQNGAVDRLAVQQADLRAHGSRLTAVREQVAELKRQSAVVLAQRTKAQQDAAAAETQISTLAVTQQQQVTGLQTKIAAEKAQLDASTAEQAKLQAVLIARAKVAAAAAAARAAAASAARARNRGTSAVGASDGGSDAGGSADSGGSAPGSSGGVFDRPSTAPISSGFGMRYHPILHIYRMHTGTDFAAPCGSAVYAVADGDIISAGWAGGYGNRVVIDHGWIGGADLATTYNHLTRIVRSGGSVRRGDLIAYSGTTGLSTGCHLHFEVLRNGVYVDPMNYLG